MLTTASGTNWALGVGSAVLSGREPNKNVPLLGYLLCMTHSYGLMAFASNIFLLWS